MLYPILLALMSNQVCLMLAHPQVSWQMLGIQQMNTELTSAVSTPELRAQMLANQGSLTNQNAAAVLPPFEVDMGAVAVGHLPRSFWVQLSNNGSLPVDWELHSYDAPQVGA